ncbi:hypothetical protein CKO44_00310 [Rubrivivax gelatinosus]|uniref:TrbC/VirB2 family protein n=1 Tax=Rubrivivax gelatinosus TaxID=28068 RepID=UPI001908340B|nr:TrbC/VirB2 family protein [Rubrivivax gelatinosus]MBK1611912.1 hypothetical protein [Rubrivivax gelatinosus]MBZ8143246.1 conjugal transfer protein TrbC [Rubrivivax gelatinosus]
MRWNLFLRRIEPSRPSEPRPFNRRGLLAVIVLWLCIASALLPPPVFAQGFEKVNETVIKIEDILIVISIAVVTIAIIWAGFKMIFQGARLSDVANVLIGGTLIGGAAAFSSFIVA